MEVCQVNKAYECRKQSQGDSMIDAKCLDR